mgnify:CR=1 FL=1
MTPDNTLIQWPLVMLILADWQPHSARLVLEVAREYDQEDIIQVQWKLASMDAEFELREAGKLN